MEKILWSPKIRREKLWAQYQSDANGELDEDLLADVGYGLFARCQSILMIRCGQVRARAAVRFLPCKRMENHPLRNPFPAPAWATASLTCTRSP